jgi:hypothetical protein
VVLEVDAVNSAAYRAHSFERPRQRYRDESGIDHATGNVRQ